jgi:hypothetical protein
MNKLSSATQKLGNAYRNWKSFEKEKNEAKDEFFNLATEEVADGPASRVERIYGPTEGDVLGRVIQRFPAWILKECDPIEDSGYFTVLLEEDPKFHSFTFVNPEDGMVYSKQVVSGAPYLDDDLLQEMDPELYEEVTYEKVERKLRSLDELSPQQLAKVQEYIYEGKPVVKLAAPRKAKPGELAETEATV